MFADYEVWGSQEEGPVLKMAAFTSEKEAKQYVVMKEQIGYSCEIRYVPNARVSPIADGGLHYLPADKK